MFSQLMGRSITGLIFALMASVAFAGGRYEDPPDGLVEVQKLSHSALEAAKAGNKDSALETSKAARKAAVGYFKEKSTMPMQVASSNFKQAIALIEQDKLSDAVAQIEEVVKKFDDEVAYYKEHGKL